MTPISGRARAFDWADLLVFAFLVALICAVVTVAREWSGPLRPVAEIHLEPAYLPLYGIFSLARGVVAYGVSFLFTMLYGYAMARVAGANGCPAVAGCAQSISSSASCPVHPGLVHLSRLNLAEMASVLMIFTGQVWNMTSPLRLPKAVLELNAVAQLAHLTRWRRFFTLDLSAATGLVWNSMMSMAGGWFFLT
jgi:NitT/TauT family transport system permease protein